MLQVEVLVIERLVAPDTGRSSSIAFQEISALAHEVGNLKIGRESEFGRRGQQDS